MKKNSEIRQFESILTELSPKIEDQEAEVAKKLETGEAIDAQALWQKYMKPLNKRTMGQKA